MTKPMSIAFVMAALWMAVPASAGAQTPEHFFINVNGAFQPQSHDISSSSTFTLFGETGAQSSSQHIPRGGVIEGQVGYRVWKSLTVGIGVSGFRRKGDATIVASIPDPRVINHPNSQSLDVTGLSHNETGTHIMFGWYVPITENIDVALSGGPSFIAVRQDVAVGAVVGTTLTSTVDQRKATAKGGNVGLDVNYIVAKHYGGGIFIRYAGGSVDLPGTGGDITGLKVGGFQVGAGFRFRY